MDLATIHTLYEALAGDRLGFLYSGQFHDEHTARLIALGEEVLDGTEGDRALRTKLAFVMVEAYQNIVRHRTPLPREVELGAGRSLFLLRSGDRGHEVVAVNPVHRSEAGELGGMLERIRGLDLVQLKDLFLRGLQSEKRTGRGGAGLGLIEMARRSGYELRHELRAIDEEHLLFTLRVGVGGPGGEGPIAPVHAMVAAQDILLLSRGRSTAGVQEAVLRIIEKDLEELPGRSADRGRAYLAATEFLEGVGNGNPEPIIVLGRSNGHYALVVGTRTSAAIADGLEREVAAINALSPQDVRRRYRDLLLGRLPEGGARMAGLLDLAAHSIAPLRFARFPMGGEPLLLVEALI